jgi:hypothetical protein
MWVKFGIPNNAFFNHELARSYWLQFALLPMGYSLSPAFTGTEQEWHLKFVRYCKASIVSLRRAMK